MPETPANGAPAPAGAPSPCIKHGCAECCYETEMPLQNSDIKRLEALGHKREDFVHVHEEYGFAMLKNTEVPEGSEERAHCVFLKDDRCSVYEARPEGCRHYPVVFEPGKRGPVRDVECPHRMEFNVTPRHFKELPLIIKTITREARMRRDAGSK